MLILYTRSFHFHFHYVESVNILINMYNKPFFVIRHLQQVLDVRRSFFVPTVQRHSICTVNQNSWNVNKAVFHVLLVVRHLFEGLRRKDGTRLA